jgi:hypothetical protein
MWPYNNHCFGTNMVYNIFTFSWHLQFLYHIIITKTKAVLPHVYVTLVDLDNPVYPLLFSCSKRLLHYLVFQYDAGYSNKLNKIYPFVLLSLGRYLCWWTICLRGYLPLNNQCFGTDMVYHIYIYIYIPFIEIYSSYIIKLLLKLKMYSLMYMWP